MFDANREADQIRRNTGLDELLIGKLPMGGAGRMKHAGAQIRHMSGDRGELQVIHKPTGRLPAALDPEGNDAACSVGHIFPGQLIVGFVPEAGIGHPGDPVVPFQELRDRSCVGTVSFHPQVQGIDSLTEQEGILWRGSHAEIPHEMGPAFGDIGGLAELLGINHAVIGFVRSGELRIFTGRLPVKITAVYNHAA